MDIKTLLKLPVDDLAKLTDAQKREYFAPYLKMIRPVAEESKGIGVKRSHSPRAQDELSKTLDFARKMAAKFGIKPEDI